ncbi:MAG: hypothetical protein VKO39_07940 [Cyanobacteriota bacterium]|nr:hypothetical protein [Cyanobacteriota bacterium]
MPRVPTVALSLAVALLVQGGNPAMVRAELPPWVYGEQQRRAPVVVRLRVLQAEREGNEARMRGEVLRVWRQPATTTLKPGQAIGLRYSLPPESAPGLVGPAPLPLPRPGEEVNAWLQPIEGQRQTFAPAAGGRSFGPIMESSREP